METIDEIIEAIVQEGLTWSHEGPEDVWYRDQIRPFVQAAFNLGKKGDK